MRVKPSSVAVSGGLSCIAVLGGNKMMSYVIVLVATTAEKINPIEFAGIKPFDRLGL
jgi:hypothetical protein